MFEGWTSVGSGAGALVVVVALGADGTELAATFDQGMAGKLDPPSAAVDVER